jgi:DNA-binding transcriptional regulator YiaG
VNYTSVGDTCQARSLTRRPSLAYDDPVTVAEEIRALRSSLGENTATFGIRWKKSGRTIENWEQGLREPDAFVLQEIRRLAARHLKKRKR